MKKIIAIFFLIFPVCLAAADIVGGDISYKYINKLQYEVTFKLYRDCRGSVVNNLKFKLLREDTKKELDIYPKLKSIQDISNVCKTSPKKCSLSNTVIASSINLFEEQVYSYTLDFNSAERAFADACKIQIGFGECCRNTGITTGGAGYGFWVTSVIDLCAFENSSPVFSFPPNFINCCNQPAYNCFNAIDSMDGDSLSYNFVKPLIRFNDTLPWIKGMNSQSPLTSYYPSGWSIGKSNHNVTPPIGIYLDPVNGMLIYTPTNCYEITKVSVMVNEWRKDSLGKYKIIGAVIRDIILKTITCPDNNPPYVLGQENYVVCEGADLELDFPTKDYLFIPPPPAKAKAPDTTTLSWNYGIKGASFKQITDSVRLRTGRFEWTPPYGSASSLPFFFAIKVKDNFCFENTLSYKVISIKVNKNYNSNHELKKLNNHTFVGNGSWDSSIKSSVSQSWIVNDSSGKVISITKLGDNSYSKYFKLRTGSSLHTSDTFIFLRNGKYIISHTINAINYCVKTFYDTVVVRDIPFEITLNNTDTSICNNFMLPIVSTITNGKKPFKYKWKIDDVLTTDTQEFNIKYFSKSSIVELIVQDSNHVINSGLFFIKSVYYPPLFTVSSDTIVCKNTVIKLKASPINKYQKIYYWTWLKDGIIINKTDSVKASAPGKYMITAENNYGCKTIDSTIISNYYFNEIVMSRPIFCDDISTINQPQFLVSPLSFNPYKKVNWELVSSLKDWNGNLVVLDSILKDTDTSDKYFFQFNFKNKFNLGNSNKDSFQFKITTLDSFGCSSFEKLNLVMIKTPNVTLANSYKFCQSNLIDLNKMANSKFDLRWYGQNNLLYTNWPIESEINKGIINPNYFKLGGKYLVKLKISNEQCQKMDSLDLLISQKIVPKIKVEKMTDSVKIINLSLNSIYQKWTVNSVLISQNPSIVLSKSFVQNKWIYLEAENESCNADTSFVIDILALNRITSNFITISPNPAHNHLHIKSNVSPPLELKITNQLGQTIFIQMLIKTEESIDISNLSKGIYIIEVKANENVGRVKFVKE